jgi:hypothetical protein
VYVCIKVQGPLPGMCLLGFISTPSKEVFPKWFSRKNIVIV